MLASDRFDDPMAEKLGRENAMNVLSLRSGITFALLLCAPAAAQCVQSISVPDFVQPRTIDGTVRRILTIDPDASSSPLPQKLLVLGGFHAAGEVAGLSHEPPESAAFSRHTAADHPLTSSVGSVLPGLP